MTPDRRNAVKHGPFTTWQWAVIGAYLVAIILSLAVGLLVSQALDNTRRIDRALCAEIEFLEGQDGDQIRALNQNLRALVPSCPPPQPKLGG